MSFEIIEKIRLNPVTWKAVIRAPLVARSAQPGQFVVIILSEDGERIPLTITNSDPDSGTITIIFQEVGKTTKQFSLLTKGDSLQAVLGPAGRPTHFKKAGRVVLVAGGVGIAEIWPIARYARAHGNHITAILGARSRDLLILEDEIRRSVDRLIITTDDGSYGIKGLVTQPLKELLNTEKFNLAYVVGPDIMMKSVSDVTRGYALTTIVSLDANMVDATGMCGTCRVTVGKEVKFSCVHGPEFDGHLVDWDEFLKRQKRFASQEAVSLKHFEERRCQKCR